MSESDSDRRSAALSESSGRKMADTTATPSMPVSRSSPMFSEVMPPMATIGTSVSMRILISPGMPMSSASDFVDVGNTAPHPM